MIPLTAVSERIRKHIRAGSECSKGYGAVLIRLLILSTAQLRCRSGSFYTFSAHHSEAYPVESCVQHKVNKDAARF